MEYSERHLGQKQVDDSAALSGEAGRRVEARRAERSEDWIPDKSGGDGFGEQLSVLMVAVGRGHFRIWEAGIWSSGTGVGFGSAGH
ncbi:hypothetical protein D5086_015985 [Populus alba]|uniref:Uncharacterized protein n=1 Tax=Populus alba TaxID=43335 RepID=A0ACC4BSR3_POPAL